jgi:2-dehydropantoate 2-reductase
MGSARDERLLIAGTGAMGCLFAARCAAAGLKVSLIGTWQEGIQALNRQGVCLVDGNGQEHSYAVQAFDNVGKALEGGPFCQALVLTKSWNTGAAARVLVECLSNDGVALTLQNGLGNYETLSNHLGTRRVELGVTTLGATLISPARVRTAGTGQIAVGIGSNNQSVVPTLERAGFRVTMETDLRRLLWRKLAINASINSLTAILNVPNGELLKVPSARNLMAEIANEVVRVAATQGVHIPPQEAVDTVETVARQTAENVSSMLQDIHRGAPTENEAINGSILRAAEEAGVSCPVTSSIYRLVNAIVERNAGEVYAEG